MYVYLAQYRFTRFAYFPQDVSETHTSFYTTEVQLILRSDLSDGKSILNILLQGQIAHICQVGIVVTRWPHVPKVSGSTPSIGGGFFIQKYSLVDL